MRKWIGISIICCLIFCLAACEKKEQEQVLLDTEETTVPEEVPEKTICIYVCGAVVNEGVYEMKEGSRIFEAIEAAGGFLPGAAREQVNQAEILTDEMTIYVPLTGETGTEVQIDGKININQATKEQLMTLPGVGESRAESIIKYRETHGKFKKIEDIMNISGIKEAMFEKIKEHIRI